MKIPEHYLPVMPYLIIKNAAGFKEFATNVFGAKEHFILNREGTDLIHHGELKIGDALIMFADAWEQYKERPAGMFIYVDSVDKTYQAAISNGAKILTPPAKQEYGYTAGFEDHWGNQWWIVEGEAN